MAPRAKSKSTGRKSSSHVSPKARTDEVATVKECIADTLQAVQRSSGSHEKRKNVLLTLFREHPSVSCTETLGSFLLYQMNDNNSGGISNEAYKRLMAFLKDSFSELHRSEKSDAQGIRLIRYFLSFENDKDKLVRHRVVLLLHQLLQTLDYKQESDARNELYDSIVEVFKRRLHDKAAIVAEQAAWACACFISQEDVLQQLLCAMCNADGSAVRAAAVNALTRTPPTDTNIVQHILRCTRDVHSSVRRETWEGLAKMRWGRFVAYAGESIIPYLHHGIIDTNASVQSAVAKTILSAWVTRDNANDVDAMLNKLQMSIVNDYARFSDHIDVIVLYLLRHVRRLSREKAMVQLNLREMTTYNALLWRLSRRLEHEAEQSDPSACGVDGFDTSTTYASDALSFTEFSMILQTIAIRIHDPNKAAPKGAPEMILKDFENESLLIARQLLLMIPVYHDIGMLTTATERDFHTIKSSLALLLTAAIEDDARILVEESIQAATFCTQADALVGLLTIALDRLYNNLGVVSRHRICVDDVEAYLQAERSRKSSLAGLKRHKKNRETSVELEREIEIDCIYLLRISFIIHCWLSAQRRKDTRIPGVFLQLLKVCRCTCICEEVNAQAVRATGLLCMLSRDTAITTVPVIQNMLESAKVVSEVREACYQALIDNMCEYESGIFLPPSANHAPSALQNDDAGATQLSQRDTKPETQRDDTAAARERYLRLCDDLIEVCRSAHPTTVLIGVCKLLACGSIRVEECVPGVKMLLIELFRLQQMSSTAKPVDKTLRARTPSSGAISSVISCIDSFLTHYAHSHPRRMYAVAKASIAACQEIFASHVTEADHKRSKATGSPSFTQGDFRRLWQRILHFTDAWYLQCVRQLDPSSVNVQAEEAEADISDDEIFDYRKNHSMLADDDRSKSIHHAIYGRSVARELSRCSCHEFITLGILVELLCVPSDIAARVIPELTRIRLYKKEDKVLLRQLVVATRRCLDTIARTLSSETLEKPLQKILATLRGIIGGEFVEAQQVFSQERATGSPSDLLDVCVAHEDNSPCNDARTERSEVSNVHSLAATGRSRSVLTTRFHTERNSNVAYANSAGTLRQEMQPTDEEAMERNVHETERSVDSMVRMRRSDLGAENASEASELTQSGRAEPEKRGNTKRTVQRDESESPHAMRTRSADSEEPCRVYTFRKR